LSVLKNDSAQALSQQLALWFMLWRTAGHRLSKTSRKELVRYAHHGRNGISDRLLKKCQEKPNGGSLTLPVLADMNKG